MRKPLQNYIENYLSKNPAPFHTPGHKGRLFMSEILSGEKSMFLNIDQDMILRADIPDDIYGFPGALHESEEEASKIFKTKHTFYLVNGSTAGIHCMLASCLKPGDKVIIGRNLHSSVVSALVTTGAVPVYIPVETDVDGIQLNIRVKTLQEVIEKNRDAKAVLITTPSYYGVSCNLKKIAKIVHDAGMFLLVDEAWGAHFSFSDIFPVSAVEAGADMVVQGAHKTLPVLTGSALLHLNTGDINPEKVESTLSLNQTTSPNMLFYIFLEMALGFMDTTGRGLLKNTAASVSRIKKYLGSFDHLFNVGFQPDGDKGNTEFKFDPLKLLIKTNYGKSGISGYSLSRYIMDKFSIVPEMADIMSILFIFTGFEKEEEEKKLIDALVHTFQNREIELDDIDKTIEIRPEMPKNNAIPYMEMLPRQAFFADSMSLPLEESEGWISKATVIPYPPGIPLLIPGEAISSESIYLLQMIIAMGGVVRGLLFDNETPHIEVVV